jgi:hypothetical protein
MSKSYRIRTKLGTDQNINVTVEQDFDFLEILSLKLRQEDVYSRFCADYGVVVGRVVANSGFGIPNATVSIFVPIDEIDLQDPVISTLYPYKSVTDKNEDGYRYNLLPYEKQYGGHTPTGTFPSRSDVMTRSEVLEIYEKYYRYTVKTNDSGDFMITGVPLGNQKLVLDLDLSNMGCFSLRPQDLIRMGRGVSSQFNGSQFKSSQDINSLPQIINQVKDIDVASFWGQEDLCNIGITRTDFDLRDINIEIQPTAVFMGSIFSSSDSQMLKKNCKPRTEQGDLCGLVTGPGEVLSVRQSIDLDEDGYPVLEQYLLPNGGKVIDDEGTFVTDIPMNLDYVITNEFGEQVTSNDPSIGIPTKGKYRFKVKYQSEENGPAITDGTLNFIKGDIIRANFLVPQIREYGWQGNASNPGVDPSTLSTPVGNLVEVFNNSNEVQTSFITIPFNRSVEVLQNTDAEKIETYVNGQLRTEKWIDFPSGGTLEIRVTKKQNSTGGFIVPVNVSYTLYDYRYSQFQKSYGFSLNWNEYADKEAGVKCEDFFYDMVYNKVYTTAQMIDEHRKGSGRAKFMGIKEILDRGCESTTNKFPTNDGVRNFDFLFLLFNIIITIIGFVAIPLIVLLHVIAGLWPILKWFLAIFFPAFLAFQAVQFGIAAVSSFPAVGLIVVNALLALVFAAAATAFAIVVSPLLVKFKFKSFNLPMMSYPDCLTCDCDVDDLDGDEITTNILTGKSSSGSGGVNIGQSYVVWDNSGESILAPLTNTTTWSKLAGDPANEKPVGMDPDNYSGSQSKKNEKYQANLFGFRYGLAGYADLNSPHYGLPITRDYTGLDLTFPTLPSQYFLTSQATVAQSMNLMNVRSRYFNSTYNTTNGQNIIKTEVNGGPEYTDNVVMMLVSNGSFNQGDIVTFNDVGDINDTNYSGSTNPINQFGSQSITGTSMLTATKTINYINENGGLANATVAVSASTTEKEYEFKTGVEYFQVITTKTFTDIQNTNGGIINRHFNLPQSEIPYFNPDNNSVGYVVGNPFTLMGSNLTNNFKLVIMVRGVDVWTDKQNIKYDLSKLSGQGYGTEVVSGDFYMNVPIQEITSNRYSNTSHTISYTDPNQKLYHEPYNFAVDPSAYSTVTSNKIKYYSSLGENFNGTWNLSTYATSSAGNVVTSNDNINKIRLFASSNPTVNVSQNIVNGGTLLVSPGFNGPAASPQGNAISPKYGNINVNISGPNPKLIIRSDNLPTSDNETIGISNHNSMAFHLNRDFAVFKVDADGGESLSENGFDTSDGAESLDDEFNNNASINSVTDSFSCANMVPLECYQPGPNNTIIVIPNCPSNTNPTLVKNGCYTLLQKPYFSIGRDIGNFTEWKARFRMMFGICRNVMSLTFVNNWVNGTLYMYSFQKQDVYSNDINDTKFLTSPDYDYCKDTISYQEINNSFFYRASPFNNGSFTGKLPPLKNNGNTYPGQNNVMLGNPTTIMDLGPRDEFLQEICFNDDYQGYIIDSVSSTSYKDTSDLLQVFIISRLSNTTWLGQITGLGNASIRKLFSRENQRLDGDLSQLISINSEFGVTPFLGNNYSGDAIYYDVNSNDPNIGIFFEGNTIDRDLITPGRVTFRDNQVSSPLFNYYGFKDQEIPFHPWTVKNNGVIFGDEDNDWSYKNTTSSIYTVNYQSIDRLTNPHTFPSSIQTPTSEKPGFIYNSKLTGTNITYNSQGKYRDKLLVGAPYHFYFGLRSGKSAMNKYIDKFILNQEIL